MRDLPYLQLLACIGEQFSEGEELCGVVVNVRAKQDRLCVWTKSASNEAAQVSWLTDRSILAHVTLHYRVLITVSVGKAWFSFPLG